MSWNIKNKTPGSLTLTSVDGCMNLEADVRFDGCVHLRRYYIRPDFDDVADYIHICDVDELIALLTELRDKATEVFGEW